MARAKGAPRKKKIVGKLPSRQDILDYLASATGETGKREIARAFGVKGGDRIALKELLRDMADDGLIAGSRRKLSRPGTLPPVTVLEITGRDPDGEFVARPAQWDEEHGPAPRIIMAESKRDAGPVAGIGDRVLARVTPLGPDADYPYQARTIKRLARAARSLLGIFRSLPGGAGVIDPIDRKQLKEWPVARGATNDAENSELVRFELARGSRMGVQTARVTERLGNPQAQQMTSLIAVHAHGIPDVFPEAALTEAEAAKEPELQRREDLRHVPLVTIDPVDARDHDDAVFAEPDPNPQNRGGWVVIVAIADVAAYVRPGSALDKEARKRVNSVYFPDRVVPMLPERLSGGLCSLTEDDPRACLAVSMVFDKNGKKLSHRFFRALMRSAASNIGYARASAKMPRADRKRKTAELLAMVGLSGFEDRPARRLSGGEQQRLALARALARDPEILFLDEPTASLDPAAAKSVEDVLRAVGERGVKIVMSTHDLGTARRLAGDCLQLD